MRWALQLPGTRLSVALVLSSFLWAAANAASAATFDFTYSGSFISIANGVFTATGGPNNYTITNVSATVDVSGIIYQTTGNSLDNFLGPDNSLTFPSADYLTNNGVSFQAGGEDFNLYLANASPAWDINTSSLGNDTGTLTVDEVGAPGPAPGAGELSWSVLALGMLWWRRRAAWGYARTVAGWLSQRPLI